MVLRLEQSESQDPASAACLQAASLSPIEVKPNGVSSNDAPGSCAFISQLPEACYVPLVNRFHSGIVLVDK